MWLERDALSSAFRHFGLSDITVVDDDRNHPNGPCFMFTAVDRRSDTMRKGASGHF